VIDVVLDASLYMGSRLDSNDIPLDQICGTTSKLHAEW